MKNTLKILILTLTMGVVFWSCKKDLSNNETILESREFVGGVIEDEIITPPTKDFMMKGSTESITINNIVGGDATPPVGTIISPAPGQLMPNGPTTWTITVTATDIGGSGVKRTEMRVYNDGYEYLLPNSTPTQTSWIYTPNRFQYSNYSVILLYVYDNAGNISGASIGVYRTQNLYQTPLPSGFPTVFSMVTPPVLNQGSEQSTTSIAVGYNQFSIAKYYRLGSNSFSNSINVMSPEMLYNAVKLGGSVCGGTRLNDNYSYLANNGTCFWSSLPYSNTNGCSSSLITNSMVSEARRNKINYNINRDFIYVQDKGLTKITLNNKRPLVVLVRMENTAYNSAPGFIWNSSDGSSLGSTALTIVGFDDTKRAYKCMTTWGPNRCSNGFLWVDYDHMTRLATQAWYLNVI